MLRVESLVGVGVRVGSVVGCEYLSGRRSSVSGVIGRGGCLMVVLVVYRR